MNQQAEDSLHSMTLEQVDEAIKKLKARRRELLADDPQKLSQISSKNIVVVGGGGKLGRLFVEHFNAAGHKVSILEKNDWPQADSMLANAQLVLVAVPMPLTEQTIARLSNLPKQCILADITSIKAKPLSQMLKVHSGPVVGLHPMFGPDANNFNKQTIIVCHGRQKSDYAWLLQQFKCWQANVELVDADNHDQTMAIVQVLRHLSTVAYGYHLAEENQSLQTIMQMSSPIYRLELAMVGRLFAQDPELYTEIIFADPNNIEMMQRFSERFSQMLALVKDNNKQQFKQEFIQTREWFGDYAKLFLDESSQMLAATKRLNQLID